MANQYPNVIVWLCTSGDECPAATFTGHGEMLIGHKWHTTITPQRSTLGKLRAELSYVPNIAPYLPDDCPAMHYQQGAISAAAPIAITVRASDIAHYLSHTHGG